MRHRGMLTLVLVGVCLALCACGSSVEITQTARSLSPSPSAPAVVPAGDSPSPTATDPGAALPGMYADLTYGQGRLLLWDDGRYTYSNGAEFSHGTYTFDPATLVVALPAVGGTLRFDAATRVLTQQDTLAEPLHFAPLPQQDPSVGRDAQGRPWNELDEEHQRRFDEMDDIIAKMKAEADAIAAERGTDTSFDPLLLGGTWGSDGDTITVTIDAAEGTWHSGIGLTYSYGSFQVSGLTVVFLPGPDPQHPEDQGPPGACPMGNGATYDPQTGELIGESGGRWHKGAIEPEPDPNQPF